MFDIKNIIKELSNLTDEEILILHGDLLKSYLKTDNKELLFYYIKSIREELYPNKLFVNWIGSVNASKPQILRYGSNIEWYGQINPCKSIVKSLMKETLGEYM